MKLIFKILFLSIFMVAEVHAQDFTFSSSEIDYASPKKYEIGGITVEGAVITDVERIISFSGLRRGKEITIPGSDISSAIKSFDFKPIFSLELGIKSYLPEIKRLFGENIS